ncbi:MAG TPA: polysaccharide pyruvyl transferase family protein [Planctomycetota bacterium]|jgi:polysaccharide pyruvyl transferase WcaK-like protein
MNVVISGPFGYGSLADEAVLAGLLKHLPSPKHSVTVLSADSQRTEQLHAVSAVEAGAPTAFLSNRSAWTAIQKAHLFVIASAGPVNELGKYPARLWLAHLEPVQIAEPKTAVIGIGATPIPIAQDRARVQRLLHHNAEAVSTRDESSKRALMACGLAANRVSVTGDPTLALTCATASGSGTAALPSSAVPAGNTLAVILAQSVPSRTSFDFQPAAPSPELQAYTTALIKGLLQHGDAKLLIVHDDTDPSRKQAEELRAFDFDRIELLAPDEAFADFLQELAQCRAAFSFSRHGILLSGVCGVPAVALSEEPGAPELLSALGLQDFAVDLTNPEAAIAVVARLAADTSLRTTLAARVAGLRKREAQNGRILELLVPRRVARERGIPSEDDESDEDESGKPKGPPKPKKMRQKAFKGKKPGDAPSFSPHGRRPR